MKREFEKPELEVIIYEDVDIITTSGTPSTIPPALEEIEDAE